MCISICCRDDKVFVVVVVVAGAAAITTGFTNSVGTVHLDNVMCTGNEQRLAACPADPVGMTDCTDVENAGVRCELGKDFSYDPLVVAAQGPASYVFTCVFC